MPQPTTTAAAAAAVPTTKAAAAGGDQQPQTSSAECHVEYCLYQYHLKVEAATPDSVRCQMLTKLMRCMQTKPLRCRVVDARYMLIDEKRLESWSSFNCGSQGS